MARYLVVDDDHSTVKGMTLLLRDDGHDVLACTKGADAVEALSRLPFDAVVTDLEMPVVDGHAVVRATRECAPLACVVVVSTHANEKRQALTDAGACFIADKPLDYAEVTKAISDCRAGGGPGGEGRCHLRSRSQAAKLVQLRRR